MLPVTVALPPAPAERRVREFLLDIISSTTATPMQVPPGLSATAPELARVGGQLLRLVAHNRAVFGAHYTEILEGALPRLDAGREAPAPPAAEEESGGARAPPEPQPGPAH